MIFKKLVSALLAAALIVSSVGTTAFATYEVDEESYDISQCYNPDFAEMQIDATLPTYECGTNYKTWSQGDSCWGSMNLGNSTDTCAGYGCLVTAITKLIIQCGLREPETFQVDDFLYYLNNNGGFVNGNLQYGAVNSFDSNFKRGATLNSGFYDGGYNWLPLEEFTDEIITYISSWGVHIVIEVPGANEGEFHWVAVDEAQTLANGEVYIMDNGYNGKLLKKYTTFRRIDSYEGGTIDKGDSPDIYISGASSPTYMQTGETFSVTGTVISGQPLTEVSVGYYDADGNVLLKNSAKPNSTSYDISKLSVSPSSFSEGAYWYKVIASNAENTNKVLLEKAFFIYGANYCVTDGTYKLKCLKDTSYLVAAAGSESGDNVHLEKDVNNPDQVWLIRQTHDGYYSITNYATGLSLDVANASAAAGTNIQQCVVNGSNAQNWMLSPAGDSFLISSACAPANCLDVDYAEMANGTNITNYSNYLGNNQRFVLEPTDCDFTKGNKITFDACGGTLQSAYASYTPDGVNTGRGEGDLVVYNVPNDLVYTNQYGVEALVRADGKVIQKRAHLSTEQLTVPEGGMVVSAHADGVSTAANFIDFIMVGDYVKYDSNTQKVYAYLDYKGYLANHKYVETGSTYGTLPTPTRDGYTFDGWYTSASGGTKVTSDSTFSASKLYAHWNVIKKNPTVTAPTAKSLTYTGKSQALVNAGSTTGGKMYYSLDGTNYSTSVPTAIDAGTYTVYYNVRGGTDYNDVAAKTVSVTINKATPAVTAPTAKSIKYTGSAQTLVNAGSATVGTLEYSLDGTTYSTTLPKATKAGTYTVYYRVTGTSNYNSVAAKIVSVTITKNKANVTAPTAKTLTYNGKAQALVNAGTTTYGYLKYSLDGVNYSTDIPTATNAGTYTVYYKVDGTANYNGFDVQTIIVVIESVLEITEQPTDYEGEIGATATFAVEASGENLTYQWQQNTGNGWTNINTTAGRKSSISIGINETRAKYQYRCVVSDGTTSVTSTAVKMIIKESVAITTQPTNYTGAVGTNATFKVVATGAKTYQWQQNTGNGWANINTNAGRSASISIGITEARAKYQYRCVVSDGTTSVTSNVVKMIIKETLEITEQPVDYIGAVGGTARFTIEATGATSYQWYQNTGSGWTAINTSAGRSNVFSVGVAEFRLGYFYRCVVSDGTNTLTSNEVQMIAG